MVTVQVIILVVSMFINGYVVTAPNTLPHMYYPTIDDCEQAFKQWQTTVNASKAWSGINIAYSCESQTILIPDYGNTSKGN